MFGTAQRPLSNRSLKFATCCDDKWTFPDGQVAQLVEQRTENPCVGSSSLPLTTYEKARISCGLFLWSAEQFLADFAMAE